MKKIVGMLIVIGVVFCLLPATMMASPVEIVDDESTEYLEADAVEYKAKEKTQYDVAPSVVKTSQRVRNRYSYRNDNSDEAPQSGIANKKNVTFRGIWGLTDNNETNGYFAGRLIRRGRVGIMKGIYNTIDSEEKGKFIGIMKKGYFNGRIINPEGNISKITGFYHIDTEEGKLKLRWMTPNKTGWAIANLKI